MNKNTDYTDNDKVFVVTGVRVNTPDIGGKFSGDVTMEIIGVYDEIDSAIMHSDIISELDTTFHEVIITESPKLSEVPEMEIMLRYSVIEGKVIIRSQCVDSMTEPWLRDDDERFESLAIPEHKEAMTSRAIEWHVNKFGTPPVVIEDISRESDRFIKGYSSMS